MTCTRRYRLNGKPHPILVDLSVFICERGIRTYYLTTEGGHPTHGRENPFLRGWPPDEPPLAAQGQGPPLPPPMPPREKGASQSLSRTQAPCLPAQDSPLAQPPCTLPPACTDVCRAGATAPRSLLGVPRAPHLSRGLWG